MHKSNLFKSALILAAVLSTPTLVWAANYGADSGYEEVSYDELLNELSAKKKRVTQEQTQSSEMPQMQAGLGYVNSFTNLGKDNKNYNRHASGIQLSAGVSLFSANWYSEGIFRNYGTTTSGSEDLSIREIEARLGYTNKLEGVWNYTLAAGLSNRFLKFSDPTNGVNIDETTPSLVISTGFFAQVHRRLSLGAEISARSPMMNKSADKSSVDLAFRMTTSL